MPSMLRSGLLFVLLAQLSSVGAVGAQPGSGPGLLLPPGLRALYQQPGWQAVVAAGTVVVVEDGFTHLRGVAGNGQTLWRTQYQPAPRGMQELFAFAGGALMYAGERLVGLNLHSGAIQSDTKVPFLTGSFAGDADTGCWLNHIDGVCSLNCACSFQFVRCQDGANLGPRYDFNRSCRQEMDLPSRSRSRSSSCGCWGSGGTIVGKSGNLLVAALHGLGGAGATAETQYASFAVGVDARSGAEVWRRKVDPQPASYTNGAGVTASGRTFWLGDAMGALTALDGQTGQTLWRVQSKEAEPPHMPESWAAGVPVPAGIFHFSRAGATLYDERSGKPLWSRPAAGVAFAVPRGAPLRSSFASQDAGPLLVLAPGTGQVATTLELERKDAVVLDAGSGQYLVQLGRTVRLHDSRGTVLARATLPFERSTIVLGDSLLVAASTEGLAVLDRRTLALRGRLAGWFTVVAVEQKLGPRRFVIERYGDAYYTGEQKLRQIALIEVDAENIERVGAPAK